jgi:hypothetical protein
VLKPYSPLGSPSLDVGLAEGLHRPYEELAQLEAAVVEFGVADLASSLLGLVRVDVGEAVLPVDRDPQLCQRGRCAGSPNRAPVRS